jgi:hypothetical protein
LCLITRNRHEAEEIMQDAFLSLLERWDRGADGSNVTPITDSRDEEQVPSWGTAPTTAPSP